MKPDSLFSAGFAAANHGFHNGLQISGFPCASRARNLLVRSCLFLPWHESPSLTVLLPALITHHGCVAKRGRRAGRRVDLGGGAA